MKKKTARRWLKKNNWKIAKVNLEMIVPSKKFEKQYKLCVDTLVKDNEE